MINFLGISVLFIIMVIIIEFYLFSDKMYLYPDEVLRALQKRGRIKVS